MAGLSVGLNARSSQLQALSSRDFKSASEFPRTVHLGSRAAGKDTHVTRGRSRTTTRIFARASEAVDRSESPSGRAPSSIPSSRVVAEDLASSPEGAIRQAPLFVGASAADVITPVQTNGAATPAVELEKSPKVAQKKKPRSSSVFVPGKQPETPTSVLEYFKACASLEGSDFGPPRFFCPLDAKPRVPDDVLLPKLFFLPGIEGTGFGLQLHHKSLANIFELSSLNVPKSDRTSFLGMVEIVERAIREENAANPGRAIFLMGESFGAVLSLAVAERNPGLPLTLVLVNPATSFERSEFRPLMAAIPFIPESLYPALPALLAFSLGNPVKMASSGIKYGANPIEKALAIRENLLGMIPTLPEVGNLLPKATLVWKLKLLDEGVTYMERLIENVTYPTLILASEDDKLIPSAEEATRLKSMMKNSKKVIMRKFKESGHTLLLEGDLDLAAIIKASTLYRRTSNPRENPFTESFAPPTAEDLARTRSSGMDGLVRFLTSPVFLSTTADGSITQGLSGVPVHDRPILFVGNHQTYAPDLSVMIGEVLERTGVLMRGLAHPMAMGMLGGETADTGMSDTFRLFGAVPVSPTSAYKLMAAGEAVLLFPGGVREALSNRGEEYMLFWPDREEFIRLAIKFGATIVPFAAVGVDDGYEFVLDGNELLEHWYFGPRMKKFIEEVPRVRDESAGPAMEKFSPPIVLPKQINRLYFLFKQPIRTAELGFGLKD